MLFTCPLSVMSISCCANTMDDGLRAGVAVPLAGKKATSGGGGGAAAFALGRAFAAGVVLATGLVHMLPAAMHALSVSC
jgi:hypothetical protein